MRRRLVVSTIAIVLVVLGVLAVPIALIVQRSGEDEVRARLDERIGLIDAALVAPPDAGRPPSPTEVADALEPGEFVRLLAPDGSEKLPWSPGEPGRSVRVTRASSDGGRIEVAGSTEELDERFRSQMATLLMLATGALVGAAALAWVQARQLARPLERLAATAGQLGEGDFSVAPPPATQIGEIDDITAALRRSARQIDEMLSTERHFTADATHQLRSGLTGLSMRFELLVRHPDPAVVAEAAAGLEQCDQLDRTIDELLAVARQRSERSRSGFDLAPLARAHLLEWRRWPDAERREIELVHDESVRVLGTKGLAGQVLDIMVHNALLHGDGTVRVELRAVSGGGVVDVTDDGPGFDVLYAEELFRARPDPAAKHGRGLVLARRLARADGGSLEVVSLRPATVRYRLPTAHDGPDTAPPPTGRGRGR